MSFFANVSFNINFCGDVKYVSIKRDFIGEYDFYPKPETKTIDLGKVSSPYRFTYKIHLEDGDNYIPIILTDNHGNSTKCKLNIPAHFTRQNTHDINIDNDIDINNY